VTAAAKPAPGAGVTILGPEQSQLLRELERVFTGWAEDAGAVELIPPPVYDLGDLDLFDVYENFPHLSLVASALDVDRAPATGAAEGFEASALRPARWGLSSATCYGAYLYFRDTEVSPTTTVTLVNRCFRNEDRYEGLRRLLSFQMREIVALGSWEHTQDVLEAFTKRIEAFASELSLPLRKVAASDPFFRRDGTRALFQKLSPVKYEFEVDGLAISSVNTHRNFFGERCAIGVSGSEDHAFTSCVAFGLERWVAVLNTLYDGDLAEAARHVRAAGGASG
jgi:seryl-tRNA synthetase